MTCELHSRSEDFFFQFIGNTRNIADFHLIRVVENKRNIGTMPGYLAILIREIQGKQVEIGRCLSSFGMKLRKRLGGLAEYTIQRKYVNRLFIRICFQEKLFHLICMFAVCSGKYGSGFLLRQFFLIIWSGHEGEFPEYGSHHKRNGFCMVTEACDQRFSQIIIIDHRHAAYVYSLCRQCRGYGIIGFCKLIIRNGFQLLHFSFRYFQLLQKSWNNFRAVSRYYGHNLAVRYTAHDNGFMEQAVRFRYLHQPRNLHSAAGLSEQRHILRIPAEFFYIVMNPPQSRHKVSQPCVTGIPVFFPVRREIQKTEDIQPVVYRHNNDISLYCHIGTVIGRLLNGGTRRITASVQPYHNRFFSGFFQSRRPHIQILAVFILRPVTVRDQQLSRRGVLGQKGTYKPVRRCFLHPFPWLHFPGHLEPACLCIGDPFEDMHPVKFIPLYFSRFCGNCGHFIIIEYLCHSCFSPYSFKFCNIKLPVSCSASHYFFCSR